MRGEAIIDELEWRGLVYQASDLDGIRARCRSPLTLYVGFDPSADSLHVGSLVPLLTLRRFQLAGHRVIALVGGGTGLVGDPSGKSTERNLDRDEVVSRRVDAIRAQIEYVLRPDGGVAAPLVEDNRTWLVPLRLIDFLRDVGKHFTVNWMIAKESVAARLGAEGGGLSFTEFSYMLLQAFDYTELMERHGCELQIGGSDQWGNITAGLELARRKHGRAVHALTVPLITTASGAKLGKTERGTVWLDATKTSPFAFYQYWFNTDDRDVGRYLRYFTFLPRDEIVGLEEAVAAAPQRREAQARLAHEVTELIHGEEAAARAEQTTAALFGTADPTSLTADMLVEALDSVPNVRLEHGAPAPSVVDLLAGTGLAASKSEARRFVEGGGAYLNDRRWTDRLAAPADDDFIDGEFLILRRGKRNVALVQRPRGDGAGRSSD
jgi:tyrosyl-tRNA synthetase